MLLNIELVPWAGLEPACPGALPPQDSVSTNFTTTARSYSGISDVGFVLVGCVTESVVGSTLFVFCCVTAGTLS